LNTPRHPDDPTDPAVGPDSVPDPGRTAAHVQGSQHFEPTRSFSGHADAGGADSHHLGAVIANRYKLVKMIGEGGMGSVYLAQQSEPVKRDVALKLIKAGMDSASVLHRFEAERQALALMDHPNIARIYDGGLTPARQPFFVMELVPGIPITRFCDERQLGIAARLELFVSVCQAVQHAHQKGIIHRDLKPGNILVIEVDGRPTPKVIDFGVAKATEQKLTELSFADVGAIVGTPMYMSPEQADPTTADIDTRTDVYSLGVILYELLVGSPPIDASRFKRGALLEMLRMVRDDEPPRPSTKLSAADARPSIAANRAIEPSRLAKLLKNELDWITLKALDKDRTRRYDTAIGLAHDVQRYLADEPVEARPPSTGYRMRKFVRRHRGFVAATAAVAVTLVVGIVGFAWQAKVARGQRDRAIFAEGQTQRRADELEKVADYQGRMLKQIDPADAGLQLMTDLRARHGGALDKSKAPEAEKKTRMAAFERELHAVNATDVAVALIDRTVLAPAVRTIDREFADQPVVDAALRATLGEVYQELGRAKEALALHQRAKALRLESLGADDRATLASQSEVGKAMGELQQLSEAESLVRATLAAYERTLGSDHPETLEAKELLVIQLRRQGKYEECESVTRDVLEQRRRMQGPEHLETLNALNEQGICLMDRGKLPEAVAAFREAVGPQRRLDATELSSTLNNLGVALMRQRDFAGAEPVIREVIERRRRALGENHPLTVSTLSNMAMVLVDLGKFPEAERLAQEALEKCRRHFGSEHVNTLTAMNVTGQVYMRQSKYDQTEPLYREAFETGRRVLGESHPDVIIWTTNLAFLRYRQGRFAQAEPLYRDALDKNRRQLGETHPYTLRIVSQLSELLSRMNRPAEVEGLLREVLEKLRSENKGDLPDAIRMQGYLGGALLDQGKLDEAEPCLRQALESSQRLLGPRHPNTLLSLNGMARLRVAQGKYAEALALLDALIGKAQPPLPASAGLLRPSSLGLLGKAQAGLAKHPDAYAAAEANLLEAYTAYEKSRGAQDKDARNWAQALAELYAAWDKAAPGKGYDARAAQWKAKSAATSKNGPSK
jgi:tetratricopeptide (TPR) repeat protein